MPHRWSRRGVRRLRRLPTAVRRRARRGRHRLPWSGPPVLTVVLVDRDDPGWLATTLTGLRTGSAGNVEILLVGTGTLDEEALHRLSGDDPCVRLLHAPGARPGSARNLAAAAARGDFLAFPDSAGVMLDDAWPVLVDQLVRSGSDFVTGGILRGTSADSARPVSPGLHAHDRSCLRVTDRPALIADTSSSNKVFRTSFWRRLGLAFDASAEQDDPAVCVAAYLGAASVDAVGRPVQLRRSGARAAHGAEVAAVVDSLTRCARLLSGVAPRVRETWLRHLLDHELPGCLEAWLRSSDVPEDRLRDAGARLLAEIPEAFWSRVPFRGRARSWALLHARRELGEALYLWMQREAAGLQTVTEDGRTSFAPPFRYDEQELPAALRRVHAVDVRPVARLRTCSWEDDRLLLRGSAYLLPFPDVRAHELQVLLEVDGAGVELPVRRYVDPELDVDSHRSNGEVAASGFEVELDATALAARLPPGEHQVEVSLVHRQEGFERRGGLTEAPPVPHVGWAGHRLVDGRLVRPWLPAIGGIGLEVRDTWARLVDVRASQAPDEVELVLQVGGTDGAAEVLIGDRRARRQHGDAEGLRVTLDRGRTGRLAVRSSSGTRTDVLWALGDSAVCLDGWVVRADPDGAARVDPPPLVQVDSLEASPGGVLVRGVSSAPGTTLCLSGPRATSGASLPLPAGPFSVEVPTTWDPWGRGPTALPADRYRLVRVGNDGALQDPVRPTWSLARVLPLHVTPALSVAADPNLGLGVAVHALPREEGAARRQAIFRREVYPRLRAGSRRPAVLFESFRGAGGGDSPAALAGELHRRDLGLDLAWTVVDDSVVPPEGTRPVLRHSQEWFALLAEAAYLVNNNNFPHFFAKAEGQVYLQTWHGTPLKRIAGDIEDQGSFPLTYLRTMEAEARAWDHLVSPSPYCTEIFRRAFGYDGPVLELGHPRNDALVGADAVDRRAVVRAQLGLGVADRVVLYTPTWRDGEAGAGERRLLLDADVLTRLLPDVILLVRGHANTAAADRVGDPAGGRVRDVTLHPDINDLFLASDALVTDYSSVMFDYAVLDRPMFFLVPDLEDYRDRARGFYLDFEQTAPGPLLADTAALGQALEAPDAGAAYARSREAFRRRFAPRDDGHAAARVVDALFPGT